MHAIAIHLIPMGYSDTGDPIGLSGDIDIEYAWEEQSIRGIINHIIVISLGSRALSLLLGMWSAAEAAWLLEGGGCGA